MAVEAHTTGDTRTRLLSTALRLFTEHGVEGTSLQMIADELGVTKAAVYYYFRTKAEITEAVAEPALKELDAILDRAERIEGRGARAEHVLTGFVNLVVEHRALVALFSSDPGVARAVEKSLHGAQSFNVRLPLMLAGSTPETATMVAVHVALSGIALAGGSPALAGLDDAALRQHLLGVGRRLLELPGQDAQ